MSEWISSMDLWPVISKLFGLEGRSVVKATIELEVGKAARVTTTENVEVGDIPMQINLEWRCVPVHDGQMIDTSDLRDRFSRSKLVEYRDAPECPANASGDSMDTESNASQSTQQRGCGDATGGNSEG